jgi:hypothetical protein
MAVTHLFMKVFQNDGAGVFRLYGEVRPGHPINEIPLEYRRIPGDDPAPLMGREMLRIR